MSDSSSGGSATPPPLPTRLGSPPSYESLGPPDTAVSTHTQPVLLTSPVSTSNALGQDQSLNSIAAVSSPQSRQDAQVEGVIPDASPPPPYSPRRWSIAFSRASSSLQRNVGCLIILIVFLVVPLAILVIGIVYYNNCSAQPLITIFLITGGLGLFFKIVFLIIEGVALRISASVSRRLAPPKKQVISCCCRLGHVILNIFLIAWTGIGGYWVFSKYDEVVNVGFFNCNEVVYKFSFSAVILCGVTILFLSACVCVACLCVSVSLHSKKARHSSGEVVCSTDWVINGGGAGGVAAVQEIRIEEVGTEEDEGSDVSYREMQVNDSHDGGRDSSHRIGVAVTRQVPVEVTPVSDRGLMSVDEEEEDEEEEEGEHASVNSSMLSPALHLESQELDTGSSWLGSATLSNRASNGHQFAEMTSLATGHIPTSYLSRSLQRQPNSFAESYFGQSGGIRQPRSSFSHLDSVPYFSYKRHSSDHSTVALKNTTSSYVNVAPIPSVRHALTLSECIRSNPQLYRPPQRTLQHQRDTSKTNSMDSHTSRRQPRYPSRGYSSQDRSRASLREPSLDGSTLYITVQTDGHSTTFV